METLITSESAKLIHDVQLYLQSETISLEITTTDQKQAAITLGNELQKKYRAIEEARKKEKGVWDAKAKAVQEEFKPVLDKIDQKKRELGAAIMVFDKKLEEERQERQRLLDEQAARERAKLEAFAGKREEKLRMYQAKLDEINEKLKLISGDPDGFNALRKEALYYASKVNEFTEKVADTQAQAAQVVAPIYQPEEQGSNKGTRKSKVPYYKITNFKDFVAFCVALDECQFLMIDEAKLKARIKEKEGVWKATGLEVGMMETTGFSGR